MYGTFRKPKFSYRSSLPSTELRLLKPEQTTAEPPSFTVSTVKRSSAPRYTAVSYTWGEEQPDEIIYLDGATFPVRRNLYSLLHYLGRFSRSEPWDYLWVDAICINQEDISERTAQVSTMDQTYRAATCVSVWLGLAPVHDDILALYPLNKPIRTIDTSDLDWDLSMVELSTRPYWSRFWVIQEFLLGKNVEIYCSNHRINWMDFQDILCRVSGVEQFGDVSQFKIDDFKSRTYPALPLVMGRHVDKHPESLQPLHDLLVDHRRSKCKDPRDRIFALLGLVTNDERDLLRRVLPDYALTEEEVIIYTLAHLIQYGPLVPMQREPSSVVISSG